MSKLWLGVCADVPFLEVVKQHWTRWMSYWQSL